MNATEQALVARLGDTALTQPSPAPVRSLAASPSGMPAVKEPARQHEFSGLAPGFALRLYLHLRDANKVGLRVGLFEGLRTDERQRWLYAAGRTRPGPRVTNASTGLYGWHLYGLAGDLAFLSQYGEWYWPGDGDVRWSKLAELAPKYGLTTGASYGDRPHHQPANLRTSPSDRARDLYRAGGVVAVWKETNHLTVPDSILAMI
jgi:hypothetical protein